MLELGEIHRGPSLVHAVQPDDRRFGTSRCTVRAARRCHHADAWQSLRNEVGHLAPYPLLLLMAGSGSALLRLPCRLAG